MRRGANGVDTIYCLCWANGEIKIFQRGVNYLFQIKTNEIAATKLKKTKNSLFYFLKLLFLFKNKKIN